MRIRSLFVLFFVLGLTIPQTVRAAEDDLDKPLGHPLEKGDQAAAPVAKGIFLATDVGLLTFLPGIGDGALMYRGGMMLTFRLGGQITPNIKLYGRLGATLLDNTVCARNPNPTDKECEGFPYPPPRAARRPLARQGLSIFAGIGMRWAFLNLDDRFMLNLIVEGLFQALPPDSLPNESTILPNEKTTLEKNHKYRLNPAFGGGLGVGIGGEYFFYLKHFSFTFELTYYFLATPFMQVAPGQTNSGLLAGLMGHAILASVGLKYTFN
ncbi:hypothetical protein L6R29_02665 [Myxococcota bacterium]|nr:hypothetical protein [Myxococcota bacterium]